MLAPNQLPAPTTKWHDVTVVTKKNYQCAKCEAVPPEEFGIGRSAKSIKDADYCFHEVSKSQAKLIADGFDPECIKKIPSYPGPTNPESQIRDTVWEAEGFGSDNYNQASRMIRITEHYVRMDYEGDGEAKLYRVTTGGDEGEILTRDGDPDIVQVDAIPFAAMTPIIVTHRFFGRSIADLVMDIQRIKTALMRGMLDNLYLHNNPRVEVPDSHANDVTLDDLLVSRPGGVVRTKAPGGLAWQTVPDITPSIYPALQYMDSLREWRTGVSRQGQGLDANALQNQTATAAMQLHTAAQARMKLIARIFAETGIRDLFSLLHATIRKQGSQPETVRLKNEWVVVDPRDWKKRNDMTIQVGLGTGGKNERLAHMMTVVTMQKEALQGGMMSLVTPKNLYNSAKEVVKLNDLKDVDMFFTDPTAPDDPQNPKLQPQPDPKMMEMQAKAEIEKLQAQADIATNREKVTAEYQLKEREFQHKSVLEERKAELEAQIKTLELQIKREEHQMNMQQKAAEHQIKTEQSHQDHAAKMEETNTKIEAGSKSTDKITGSFEASVKKLVAQQEEQAKALAALVEKRTTRPKKIKGPSGKVYEILD